MEVKEIMQRFIDWTKLKIRLHVAPKSVYFYEREIWWASLGINVGYEEDGKHEVFERPVVVLKKFNRHVLWCLPVTTKTRKGQYYYQLRYNNKEYAVILSQLRLISSKRLSRKIRTLSFSDFNRIRRRIKKLV